MKGPILTKAVIYVPAGEPDRYASQGSDYCTRHGYDVDSVTRIWRQAADLLRKGLADVIVVARPEHLDPHRRPRVEVAVPDTGCVASAVRRRRPRRL